MRSCGIIAFLIILYCVISTYGKAEQVNDSHVVSLESPHPVESDQQVRISERNRLRSRVPPRSLKMVAGAESVVGYEPDGLTQGQMIGIGVGFGAGGAFCIMALVAVWERRHARRSRAADKLETDSAQRKARLLAIASTLKEAEKHNAEDSEGAMQGILLIPTPRKDIDLLSTESGAKGDSTESKNARTPVSSSAFAMTPRSPVSLRNSLIVPCVVTTTPTASQALPTPRESLVAYLAAQAVAHDTLSQGSQSPAGKENDHAAWTVTKRDSRAGDVNAEPRSAGAALTCGNRSAEGLPHDSSPFLRRSVQLEGQLRSDLNAQRGLNDITKGKNREEILQQVPLRLPIRRAGANDVVDPICSDESPSDHQDDGGKDGDLWQSKDAGSTPEKCLQSAKGRTLVVEVAATQEKLGSNLKYSSPSVEVTGKLPLVAAPKLAAQKKNTPTNGNGKGGSIYNLHRQGGGTPARGLEKISLTELVANSQATPSPRTEAQLTYRARLISEAVKESKVEALTEYVKNFTASTNAND